MVFRIEDKNFSLCFHFTNIIPLREAFFKDISRKDRKEDAETARKIYPGKFVL